MGLGDFFGGGTKTETTQPVWMDPLGYSYKDKEKGATGKSPGKNLTYKTVTGATELRDKIFSDFPSYYGQGKDLNQRFIQRAQQAAAHPGFASAADHAARTARGDYVGYNPQLEQSLAANRAASQAALDATRRRSLADYSGQAQGAHSAYSRAGMGFSTANQQAQQAAKAALLARLGESEAMAQGQLGQGEAQARLNAYMMERARQDQAGQQLAGATSTPLSYLESAAGAPTKAAAAAGNLVMGLGGGGNVAMPDATHIQRPGALDYLSNLGGALSGLI